MQGCGICCCCRKLHSILQRSTSSLKWSEIIYFTCCMQVFFLTDILGPSVPLFSHFFVREANILVTGHDGPCVIGCRVLRKVALRHCPMDSPFLFICLMVQPQSICESYEGKSSLGTGQRWGELFWQGWFGPKYSVRSSMPAVFLKTFNPLSSPTMPQSFPWRNQFKIYSLLWSGKQFHLFQFSQLSTPLPPPTAVLLSLLHALPPPSL